VREREREGERKSILSSEYFAFAAAVSVAAAVAATYGLYKIKSLSK